MKTLHVDQIGQALETLIIDVNRHLPSDVSDALHRACGKEASPFGQYILEQIIENEYVAAQEELPLCQDTGFVVVYLDIGQALHLVGGDLQQAVQAGVARAYAKGYFRASMVEEPVFERRNTGDNTPAIVHMHIVPGDKCKITVMPKGGGAENMSAVGFLKPTAGRQGVFDFVVNAVQNAGGNPCPPIVVGVGIGGSLDKVTALAKEALLRPIGSVHIDDDYAQLEADLLAAINASGIGPQGLGGTTTALAVHIESFPAHIAMLPVAVNLSCHASRHGCVYLEGVEQT